ncbi:hypothetical protein BRARA_B03568 [Brassica rapa]|uniref:HIG1 domain-containing protein n=2 Tax=Brassica TaxID=3705 RepID=A0ABQ8EED9_BRANA|nr:hypothetical protein HID58_007512 [Brassica napus]RID76603.1 hypothetical protein BRARA_B03568 [Brassica rapa]
MYIPHRLHFEGRSRLPAYKKRRGANVLITYLDGVNSTYIPTTIAKSWNKPKVLLGSETSVRIIHARLHAQALTLAGLAGAAAVEYYDHKTGATDRYPKFLKPDNLNKD